MLNGEKVILRPLRMEDLPKINTWRNDLDLIRLTQGIRFPKTVEMDAEWLDQVLHDKSNRSIFWGIDVRETGEFIGMVSLSNIGYISGTCEFGWMIGNIKHRGLGYGSEAEKLVNDYAFFVLNLRKITRRILTNNTVSVHILSSRGCAVEEGCLKRHVYFDGQYHDVVILSLFREDYCNMKNSSRLA